MSQRIFLPVSASKAQVIPNHKRNAMKYYFVSMRLLRRIALALAGIVIATFATSRGALADGGQQLGTTHVFIRSGQVNADFTQVTLPLFRGTSHGQTVYYVITDSSDTADAATRQVN